MKVFVCIGVRPNFIKLATLLPKLDSNFQTVLVHSGQHYDDQMSTVFLNQFGLRQIDYYLEIPTHLKGSARLGKTIEAFSEILKQEKPDLVLTIGDNDSSFAMSLAAVKDEYPLGHIEAGLRSFDRLQPEEMNRLAIDRLATYCFCPTNKCKAHIENDNAGVLAYFTGDLLLDTYLKFKSIALEYSTVLEQNNIRGDYGVVTLHRSKNISNSSTLTKLASLLRKYDTQIVFPMHPGTQVALERYGLLNDIKKLNNVKILQPLDYFSIVKLLSNATFVTTDSNGIQREAYFSRKPTVVIREHSEFLEGIDDEVLFIANPNYSTIEDIVNRTQLMISNTTESKYNLSIFGDGTASQSIVNRIKDMK